MQKLEKTHYIKKSEYHILENYGYKPNWHNGNITHYIKKNKLQNKLEIAFIVTLQKYSFSNRKLSLYVIWDNVPFEEMSFMPQSGEYDEWMRYDDILEVKNPSEIERYEDIAKNLFNMKLQKLFNPLYRYLE